jgi:hypothetical protein
MCSVSRFTSRGLAVLVALVLFARAGGAGADELTDRIAAVPGVTLVEEAPAPDGYRFFLLTFRQAANHFMPWKGTFQERIALLHRSFDAPTVLVTSGYNGTTRPRMADITQLIDGNQLFVEERFFPPSIPDPADWTDLTIFQGATDHHRIIQAFRRALYPHPWITEGGSHGGMVTIYHRRFYPNDVNGSVAYSAPNDVIDERDHYIAFLDSVGDDPDCRQALKDIQREALLRKDELIPMMLDLMGDPDAWSHIFGTPEKALEILVTEMPFGFWQTGSQARCADVPATSAATQDIFNFLEDVQGFEFYSDAGIDPFAGYFYEAGTQLGYPTVDTSYLADLLEYPGADVPRSFVRPEIAMPPHEDFSMIDVDLWVKWQGRQLLFVYGELDPWSAEPFNLGPGTRDSFKYVVAGRSHSVGIGALPPDQHAEAVAAVLRWAGLSAAPAARPGRRPDPELMTGARRWARF